MQLARVPLFDLVLAPLTNRKLMNFMFIFTHLTSPVVLALCGRSHEGECSCLLFPPVSCLSKSALLWWPTYCLYSVCPVNQLTQSFSIASLKLAVITRSYFTADEQLAQWIGMLLRAYGHSCLHFLLASHHPHTTTYCKTENPDL